MTLTDLRRALGHPNVAAFLRVIREGESSQTDDAYRMMFGGGLFDVSQGWQHPRRAVTAGGYTSTAAGAYQFLSRTWDGLTQQYPFPDFAPKCQDMGAVALIAGRGALQDVLDGRLDAAIAKCNKEWASLPGAPYGQPVLSMQRCRAVFAAYGGMEATSDTHKPPEPAPEAPAAAAQPQEEPMSAVALPLLAQLIPQVLSLFSARAQATIAEKTGADPKIAADFMQAMIAQVGHAVGVPVVNNATATQAVAALTAAPPDDRAAKAQALEAQALATLDALLKAGDKMAEWDAAMWAAQLAGRQVSSTIAIEERRAGLWDMTPVLVWGATILLGIVSVGLLAAILWQAMNGEGAINSALIGLAGPIWTGAIVAGFVSMVAYRFDGTKESTEQSKAVADVIRKRGAAQ